MKYKIIYILRSNTIYIILYYNILCTSYNIKKNQKKTKKNEGDYSWSVGDTKLLNDCSSEGSLQNCSKYYFCVLHARSLSTMILLTVDLLLPSRSETTFSTSFFCGGFRTVRIFAAVLRTAKERNVPAIQEREGPS
jgi:hypothetical protein